MSDERAYEEAKRLARDPDLGVRRKLAARGDLRPEILYYLAEDTASEVRRVIAANEATPHQADELLLRDRDEAVRAELAQKVARLLPGLPQDAQNQARQRVIDMLEVLARDEAARVRAVISDAVEGMANVPPEVIRGLARDADLAVASPVLRFSPLLTDEDLLDIIAGAPPSGVLSAIAGRDRLGAAVSDAIVAADNEPAVAALLANPLAQIREETLDLIIDRAAARTSWHEPLVRRPALPARAAMRIARFVADSLLDVLKNRSDLPADTRQQITTEVSRRLAADGKEKAAGAGKAAADDDGGETVEEKVRRLQKEGKLDEDAVADAIDAGQRAFVRAALAVLAQVPIGVVDKILSARSAKGVTALAWKADLPPRLAVQIQTRMGGISPRQALHPRGGKDYAMTVEEMKWQVEFFGG
ncbi:MAG TPA: DUF2336 domain-containing protein [Alphaproteobacteria bacterium]